VARPVTRPDPLSVISGIPAGWDEALADAPVTLRSRWINLAAGRIPGGFRTFAMPDGADLGVAIGGGVIAEPTGHPRFDPYQVLSGRSAHLDVVRDGPHPWRDLAAEQVFPCCLLMFPNYETAPVGTGRRDPAALRRYLGRLLDWCAGHGVRSIAALYLHHDPPELSAALADAGFAVVPMVERAELTVCWQDFDGYLAWLPRKRRAAVRGELRSLAARGVQIVERPMQPDEPGLIPLRGQLIAKYGGSPDAEREMAVHAALRAAFGPDDLTIFEARLGGKPLCFGLFVQDGPHWTGLMTGSDYTDPASAFAYFATFFYSPAAAAARRGIRQITYGLGSLEAKRLRGATLRPLYAACRTLDG
jgi:uncharacterized protein